MKPIHDMPTTAAPALRSSEASPPRHAGAARPAEWYVERGRNIATQLRRERPTRLNGVIIGLVERLQATWLDCHGTEDERELARLSARYRRLHWIWWGMLHLAPCSDYQWRNP